MTLKYRSHSIAVSAITQKMLLPTIIARGFPDARIIINWKDIVGIEWANILLPSKLKSIRCSDASKPAQFNVLYLLPLSLRCNCEFPYLRKVFIDRINLYFGYNVVGDIKLLAFNG